ncbi:DUF6351 family protein [Bacterioplanoides pacificum]|uniref:DUF6351 family protein n=1 Tax=Bacterioplanoides pacificum TaxID=1171596 RepID=A0ABV7VTR0_9GAMM
MKRTRLAVFLLTILLLVAGAGIAAAYIQKILPKLGLINDFPQVMALPPGAVKPNLPPYQGLHPSDSARPDETFAFPIKYGEVGPVRPLFAGSQRYPFLCQTEDSRLGQPLIDNHHRWGVPVFAMTLNGKRTDKVIGYSKDCLLPTRHHYLYFAKQKHRIPRRQDDHHLGIPRDVHLLIRAESGTINRHLYSILLPTTFNDQIDKPDLSRWNGKLIYYFRGGISIGFQQGRMLMYRMAKDMRYALEQGYAVIFSSATETDNTYNIQLQEDTALRLKHQFISRYGKPEFTIGFGGSGGAIQQFLLNQNHPGILDGSVAVVAYADMVTQLPYTLDCELLEYYFDHLASDKDFWRQPAKRQAVMGLSTNYSRGPMLAGLTNLAQVLRWQWPQHTAPGSECNAGWRGSVAMINNPLFHTEGHRFSEAVRNVTAWTHWQENSHIYGTDDDGQAPSWWNNAGVQYGLEALRNGDISADQFLELNSRIGSWRDAKEMQQEHYWYLSMDPNLSRFSPYGEHNMSHQGKIRTLAPRYQGNLAAAQAAYQAGMVFLGRLTTPTIDVRQYRDHQLDIHHGFASGVIRQRIIDAGYNPDLHVIWMSQPDFNPMWQALDVMDEWLSARPKHKPVAAEDSCFDQSGQLIARGKGVWNGPWNQQAKGECQQHMPFNRTSREVAGDDIRGYTLHCQRIAVKQALQQGFYQPRDMSPYLTRLQQIFPQGVCDYRQPDAARPDSLK